MKSIIRLNYDLEKKYKFGCVITTYNRQDLVTPTIESINKSFLPEDLIFIVIDDCSESDLVIDLKHDHVFIKKYKNTGVANSIVMGWDILNLLKVEYFCNLDSDVDVSVNWLSSLLNTQLQDKEMYLTTGFDSKSHKTISENQLFKVKETIGGVNMFFQRELYDLIRPALTSHSKMYSCLEEIADGFEEYGPNPKIHTDHEGWDWGVCALCKTRGIEIRCAPSSVVQHKGYYGLNSKLAWGGKLLCDTSRGYRDVCVPKIIHQTWQNNDLPDHLRLMQNSVVEKHPDYEYKFWTDSSIEDFLSSTYPDLYWFYKKGFEFVIQKIDFIRLLILYHYGGIYIDLDSLCIKNVDNILHYPCSFVSTKRHSAFSEKHYPILLNNAFIASEKHNNFIKSVILRILSYQHPKDYTEYCTFNEDYAKVLKSAGPLCVTDSYNEYPFKSMVNLLPNSYYFGVEYDKNNSAGAIIKKGVEEAGQIDQCHFVHMHESSWWKIDGKSVKPPLNKSFSSNFNFKKGLT